MAIWIVTLCVFAVQFVASAIAGFLILVVGGK
jgi:hypothetical protein